MGGVAVLLQGSSSAAVGATRAGDRLAEREPVTHRPTVEAAFASESYRRGTTARLVLFDTASNVILRLYRVGDAAGTLYERDVMRGKQVGATRRLARVARGQAVQLPLDPRWRSGLYYAKLTAPVGRVGYAPFVLVPQRLGEQRIAVVLPTQSWQAYNFRDDDGNGTADTWYAWQIDTARLHRPFENRGVPGHYRHYDEPFLRWLDRNDYRVDFLSDAELTATSGRALAEAYELIIFPGHHEYVTRHEFDAVAGFRDRGGNLIFLSGNNFFRKVTISGNVMTRIGDWPQHGRSPAALVGVQWFLGCASPGSTGKPWTVQDTPAGRWIFRGTGMRPGSLFSSGGIEADAVTPASPKSTQGVAEIRNVFGTDRDAHMTYYEAPSGAKVFAAGAFTLAGAIWQPPVRKMVANLIAALSQPAG
jgi:hypothetical protein